MQRAFTLIELSIVLVIIGLIVGGVLLGQSLVSAAAVRAQLTQIEKYNTAVNTFRDKYGALPGDITASAATQFGFVARAGSAGRGDGNGLIQGYNYQGQSMWEYAQSGETLFFWEDLSSSKLIEDTFNTNTDAAFPIGTIIFYTNPSLTSYMPLAKIGNSNFIYVYSTKGLNYYTLAGLLQLGPDGNNHATTNLTVQQAYKIDSKIDDGLPQSGKVTAYYIYYLYRWASGDNGNAFGAAPGSAAAASPTTCFDNGNNASAAMAYSLSQNSGNSLNCALSFEFQ